MKKTDEERMVEAIMKDDAFNASKNLEELLQKKCAKKIKDTLEASNKCH